MKKILYIISIAAVAAACQKQVPSGEDTLAVNIGISDDVAKVHFGTQTDAKNTLVWSTGDKVMLNGVESSALASSGNGAASATFTFNFKNDISKMSAPWNFLYCGVSGTDNTVLFPTEQTWSENNIAPNTLPMYARSASLSDIKLNHLASALKFNLTSDSAVTLKEITVQAQNNESLSGKFSLGKDTDGYFDASSFTPAGENSHIVRLSANTQLSSTAKTFYVAVPAGSYSKGFYGQFILSDNTIMEVYFDTTGETALERGKVYDFGASSYIPMGKVTMTVCNTQNFNVTDVNYE